MIAFRSVLISSVRQNSEAISQNSEAISQNSEAIIEKLGKNQGIANAGKFLVVGSDGVVVPVAMSAWQGGSF